MDKYNYNMEEIKKYMQLALAEAKKTARTNTADVPVGCIITDKDGNVIGKGCNTREQDGSVLGHAEINALEDARKKTGSYILEGAFMYVTLEPCPMCAGAIAAARLDTVFYGASNTSNGACGTVCNLLYPTVNVFGDICAEESSEILKTFFAKLRQ